MDIKEILRERARLLQELVQEKQRIAGFLDAESDPGSQHPTPADEAGLQVPPASTGIEAGLQAAFPTYVPGSLEPLLQRCRELEQAYLALLPKVPISRCPFTGQLVWKTMDTYGLDGVWWDYGNPIRTADPVPATWLGLTGSLQVTQPPPKVLFPVMPGPSAPCVIPALLAMPYVRAVLSTVSIGGNPGIAISWFTSQERYLTIPPNEWGAPWCDAMDAAGNLHRGPSPFHLPDFDTELAIWLRRGKLFWIAPNDESLLLRVDIGACPYLNAAGNGLLQYVIAGKVETLGMTDQDIRRESMSQDEFDAAMRLVMEEEGESQ